MHTAAEKGSCEACEVILNLRLDAVYDTDKKVHAYYIRQDDLCVTLNLGKFTC